MYGAFMHPHLPFQGINVGLRSQMGAFLVPPGSNVLYVRSTGAGDYDPPELTGRIFTTLNAALGQCRSGKNDYVFVLPGHTESISTADAMTGLVAGTKIIGVGEGEARPIFNWTADTATFLLDVNDVTLENLILHFAGSPAASIALTVAAPITVSGAGCAIRGCKINTGVDANQIITNGITTTAGANFFRFEGNWCANWSTQSTDSAAAAAGAEFTSGGTFLKLVGADGAVIRGNTIIAASATATDGVIKTATTKSTNITVVNNYIENNGAHAAAVSKIGMDFGASLACTGFIDYNLIKVADGATPAAITDAITLSATNDLTLGVNNFMVNDNNEKGIVIGVASS